MGRYRFALRPLWILSHLVLVAAVVVMVNLGFWQLRRLDEKRDFNALVQQRQQAPVEEIAGLVDPQTELDSTNDVTYRLASATGTYDTDNEVLVRSRSLHGQPGVWVLTPLVTEDGSAIIVNRGFVAEAGIPEDIPPEAEAPDGTVEVRGLLQPTQEREGLGASDPEEGRLSDLARADIGRIQQQVPYDLYPVFLQLEEQDPARADLPELLPPPALDEGPHLSYAVQWFLFATIAVVGYPFILRRNARDSDDAGEPVKGEPVTVG